MKFDMIVKLILQPSQSFYYIMDMVVLQDFYPLVEHNQNTTYP